MTKFKKCENCGNSVGRDREKHTILAINPKYNNKLGIDKRETTRSGGGVHVTRGRKSERLVLCRICYEDQQNVPDWDSLSEAQDNAYIPDIDSPKSKSIKFKIIRPAGVVPIF